MAHPIELGLVLEGEDAREFLEDLRNPKATKEQIEMFKEAINSTLEFTKEVKSISKIMGITTESASEMNIAL